MGLNHEKKLEVENLVTHSLSKAFQANCRTILSQESDLEAMRDFIRPETTKK